MEIQVNEQNKSGIMDFMRDKTQKEYFFEGGNGYSYVLLKSTFNVEADFLYLMYAYRDYCVQTVGVDAKYSGIYSRVTDSFIDVGFSLRNFLGEGERIDKILSVFSEAVNAKVKDTVAGKDVPVTCHAKKLDRDNKEYFLEHGAMEEAEKCFFRGEKTVSYEPKIEVKQLSASELVHAFNHPLSGRDIYANRWVNEHANEINYRLWQIAIVNKRLEYLQATPGEHHFRHALASSVDPENMKTVTVEVRRDDKQITAKINADVFKWCYNSDYSTYYMDAPSRRAFEETFGRHANLKASDVVKMTYGKKVLYQK